MYRTRNSIPLRISIRMCTHKSVSIPYPKSKRRIPFRNRTDTIYSRFNAFLLRTVTNLGYGYKRDPIPIRICINLSRLNTLTPQTLPHHVKTHASPYVPGSVGSRSRAAAMALRALSLILKRTVLRPPESPSRLHVL